MGNENPQYKTLYIVENVFDQQHHGVQSDDKSISEYQYRIDRELFYTIINFIELRIYHVTLNLIWPIYQKELLNLLIFSCQKLIITMMIFQL